MVPRDAYPPHNYVGIVRTCPSMDLLDLGARLEDQDPTLYLGVGVLSLAKAGLLGRLGRPVDRELRDAALFVGVGLALQSYQRRRRTREETEATETEGTMGIEEEEEGTDGADGTGAAEAPADERDPTDDGPVVVATVDEEAGMEDDRRRSPLLVAVVDAAERLSVPRT